MLSHSQVELSLSDVAHSHLIWFTIESKPINCPFSGSHLRNYVGDTKWDQRRMDKKKFKLVHQVQRVVNGLVTCDVFIITKKKIRTYMQKLMSCLFFL